MVRLYIWFIGTSVVLRVFGFRYDFVWNRGMDGVNYKLSSDVYFFSLSQHFTDR